MLTKIKTILLSRKTETKTEQWVKDRREICYICPYNTRNLNKISLKQKIVRFFSNALTFIMTGKFNEDDSECSICTCTLTYKTLSESEICDDGRWESIYIPNSAQKNKKQKIY